MAEAGQFERPGRKRKNRAEAIPETARLRRAAARLVGRNCQKLAKMLLEKALKGDLASAKMLLDLAEQNEGTKKKRKGPSVAEQLAREPRWEDIPLEERKRILAERGEWALYEDEVREKDEN